VPKALQADAQVWPFRATTGIATSTKIDASTASLKSLAPDCWQRQLDDGAKSPAEQRPIAGAVCTGKRGGDCRVRHEASIFAPFVLHQGSSRT
jgi:hypothetical protein